LFSAFLPGSSKVVMTESNDPRIYFAAERTMLAWVRSGIAVIGLGFVVARFGLFLRVVRSGPAHSSMGSTVIGVGLVLLGALAIAAAAFQHVYFCRNLESSLRPMSYAGRWSVWFAATLSAVGIVLAIHLLIRASES
jgi:putative membrane protein